MILIDYHDLEKTYRDLLDGDFLMSFGKCVMLFASLEYVIAYNVSLLNAYALSSAEINKKDKDENFTRNFAANITESFSKLVKKLQMVYKTYQDSRLENPRVDLNNAMETLLNYLEPYIHLRNSFCPRKMGTAFKKRRQGLHSIF
ncbi:hypothetical protein [Bartonella queenslandensis]|uniref:hypothetical protein n=1 Tax=Bartonella queenslandensis TaxID=481138 RepID=UPI000585027F|nr:hypothetical protein [Bartonella queenslandensis]